MALKKHLYMRFDCIPLEFSPFRNLKKNIGKLNSLTVRTKKQKTKKSTDRPNFQILVGWGQHNNFFFGPNSCNCWVEPNNQAYSKACLCCIATVIMSFCRYKVSFEYRCVDSAAKFAYLSIHQFEQENLLEKKMSVILFSYLVCEKLNGSLEMFIFYSTCWNIQQCNYELNFSLLGRLVFW